MQMIPVGNQLRLENSAGEAITLTADEVAKLVLNARKIFRQLTSLDPQAQFSPLPTVNAVQGRVSLDAHHTSAVVILTREDGEEDGYVLSFAAAKAMRDALANKIEEIERSAQQRRRQ